MGAQSITEMVGRRLLIRGGLFVIIVVLRLQQVFQIVRIHHMVMRELMDQAIIQATIPSQAPHGNKV